MERSARQISPRSFRRRDTAAATLALLVACCVAILASSAAAASHRDSPPARAARTLNGADTAHLQFIRHIVRGNKEVIFEQGEAKGALPGGMRAEIEITPSLLSGTCTIKTRDGSTITGIGRATPSGSGRYESFRGTLTITKGTGRYAHIRGRAGLYGTFDHRSFAMVVQTTGTLSY